MKITVWSDFACPYCYIGEMRLENALADINAVDRVEVEYKAYEIDPNASPEAQVSTAAQRMAGKYRIPLKEAEDKIAGIEQLGADLNLDFRLSTARYSSTRDAHRLMKLAESKGDSTLVRKLNFALFDAFFGKNLILADAENLIQVAQSVGMDGKEVADMLASDRFTREVLEDEKEAMMHGVKGVPYFLFDDRFAMPGAISTEAFKELLARELEKHHKHDNIVHEHPHFCDKNGCTLPDNQKQELGHEK